MTDDWKPIDNQQSEKDNPERWTLNLWTPTRFPIEHEKLWKRMKETVNGYYWGKDLVRRKFLWLCLIPASILAAFCLDDCGNKADKGLEEVTYRLKWLFNISVVGDLYADVHGIFSGLYIHWRGLAWNSWAITTTGAPLDTARMTWSADATPNWAEYCHYSEGRGGLGTIQSEVSPMSPV